MMIRARYFLALVFSKLFFVAFAFAQNDSWAVEREREFPPTEQENRILKWCKVDSPSAPARYASANIELKGYAPCGELNSEVTCDAVGNRMLGKMTRPYDHKSCSVGPRISIFKGSVASFFEKPEETSSEKLNPGEERKLKKEINKASVDQQKKEQQELTQFLNTVLGGSGSNNSSKSFPGSIIGRKQIEEIVKQLQGLQNP